MISLSQVKFLDQIGSLTTVEASNNVQTLVLERKSGMEIALGIQVGNLCPLIAGHIINLAFVHALLRKG